MTLGLFPGRLYQTSVFVRVFPRFSRLFNFDCTCRQFFSSILIRCYPSRPYIHHAGNSDVRPLEMSYVNTCVDVWDP
jgi:hypothetical protein